MTSRCVSHEACPRCQSRDNLAVYDDGHKWCFGCGHYVPSQVTLQSLNRRLFRQGEEELDEDGINETLFTSTIPQEPRNWIAKYGITDQELRSYRVQWCPARHTLVFPIYRDGKCVLTNERYFGPETKHPKYLTFGNKVKETIYFKGANINTSIVFVEDFVSAMKVSRLVAAMPLLGASIPESILDWTKTNYQRAGVWLDLNKAAEAIREASKLVMHGVTVAHAVLSTADPKELSMNEIDKTLRDYKII